MKRFSSLAAAGLMAVGIAHASTGTELVTNGSFEAEAQTAGQYGLFNSLTGWTATNQIEVRNNLVGQAQQGLNFVELDTTQNSAMSQALDSSYVGQAILSFWYSTRVNTGVDTNGLGFSLGGITGVTPVPANTSNGNEWNFFSTTVNLTGGSNNVLSFYALGTSDGVGTSLDNVSVTAVPEPETYAMFLAGLAALGFMSRRRKSV